MIGKLGFGSEDQTRSKKATGHGMMEVSGASPTGLTNHTSSQMVWVTIVSRYITTFLPKMDGMTKDVHFLASLSAAGEFAQVAISI